MSIFNEPIDIKWLDLTANYKTKYANYLNDVHCTISFLKINLV